MHLSLLSIALFNTALLNFSIDGFLKWAYSGAKLVPVFKVTVINVSCEKVMQLSYHVGMS